MLQYIDGDIFTSQAQAIACPVNMRGAMGKGLALMFRQRFPTLPDVYQGLIRDGRLTLNGPFSVGLNGVAQDIILFATKDDWRNPSRIEWIENGLKHMVARLETGAWKYQTIALPALGCGEGGLNWRDDVKPLYDLYLDSSPVRFEVYLLGE